MSLNDIWKGAEENNKQILIRNEGVEEARAGVGQAMDNRLPVVDIASGYARIAPMPVYTNGLFNKPDYFQVINKTYNLGVDVRFLLYNGGLEKRKISIAEIRYAVAEELRGLTRNEIRFKAASFYLLLKRDYFFQSLLREDIKQQEYLLGRIRELHKNGVVLKTDVLRAELRLSQQQVELAGIENNIYIGSQQLAVISGFPDSMLVQTDTLPVEEELLALKTSEAACVQEALASAYSCKIAGKELEESELFIKQVKAETLPQLSLFGKYGYAYPQVALFPYADASYLSGLVGIRLNMPVSALYTNKNKLIAARGVKVQRELQLASEREEIVRQVKEVYARYQESVYRISVAEASIARATENLRIARETYLNQLSLLTDLLDAENQLLQSKFDLAAAKISSGLLYYQLKKTIGNI